MIRNFLVITKLYTNARLFTTYEVNWSQEMVWFCHYRDISLGKILVQPLWCWVESAPHGWNRVNVSEILGATPVALVVLVVTSLGPSCVHYLLAVPYLQVWHVHTNIWNGPIRLPKFCLIRNDGKNVMTGPLKLQKSLFQKYAGNWNPKMAFTVPENRTADLFHLAALFLPSVAMPPSFCLL